MIQLRHRHYMVMACCPKRRRWDDVVVNGSNITSVCPIISEASHHLSIICSEIYCLHDSSAKCSRLVTVTQTRNIVEIRNCDRMDCWWTLVKVIKQHLLLCCSLATEGLSSKFGLFTPKKIPVWFTGSLRNNNLDYKFYITSRRVRIRWL